MTEENMPQASEQTSECGPRYSLRCQGREVEIEEADGTIATYEIRRAAGSAIEAYLDENANRISAVAGPDGRMQIQHVKSYKGMFVSLLKRCLYKDGKLVPELVIATFPHTVQKGLFEEAQEVNGLTEKAAAEAKN